MKALILSDLHLEHWREHAPLGPATRTEVDVVVLAGDIHAGTRGVTWAAEAFPGRQVVYVHGNHEAYGKSLDKLQGALRDAANGTDVHVLQMGELVLRDVRFLGCTLWTDFRLDGDDNYPFARDVCGQYMNDYRKIRLAAHGYRRLTPMDTERLHLTHRRWLKDRLAEPFDGRTVVVTHHAPSGRSAWDWDGRQRITDWARSHDRVTPAYASRLDALAEQADVWIHGHMHHSLDYRIGKCRVLANPMGYMHPGGRPENADFDAGLLIDI